MNKFKHFFLLVVFSLFLLLLISCGGNGPAKYTITWKNGDVTVKTLENIENVDEAKFDGTAPIKAKTAEYTYTFDGWEKTVNEDTKEVTYTAKFTSVKNKYNVTFVDEDGTTILKEAKAYDYGTLASQIEKPADPTKEPTNSIAYTFAGWDKEVSTVTEDVIYKAKYTSGTRKYNVKFVDDDGTTILKEATPYDYGTPAAEVQAPADPTKEATAEYTYEFTGWDRQILDVTSDITYTAVYRATKNKYNVVWKNYDGTVLETDENVEYGIMPTFDGATPAKPADANYRYMHEGWTPIVSTVSGNIEYQATFTEIPYSYYSITFNSNGGSDVESQSIRDGLTATEPKAPEKEGYSFAGWYYITEAQVEDAWDFRFAVTGDVELKAKWNVNSYALTLANDSKYGTVDGAGTYEFGSDVTITVEANTGYTYLGIYEGENQKSNKLEYTFKMPATALTYEVKWEPTKYTITINDIPTGASVTGVNSGEYYGYNTQMYLRISNLQAGHIAKWIRSDGDVSYGDSYSFTVPAQNVSIRVSEAVYQRNNGTMYYGKYPQNLVTEESIVNSLKAIVGEKPSTNNPAWKDYGYYISSQKQRFMFYYDIDIDNNGSFDYRAVYFDKYRPYKTDLSSTDKNSYQPSKGYVVNTIYFFEYNPIEWIIVKEEIGKAKLVANLALDAREFESSTRTDEYEHNGGTGYANSWELSSLRKWLNEDFYNTAFTTIQQSMILDTSNTYINEVGNVRPSTTEKIFVLSHTEYKTELTDTNANPLSSDYTKAQGVQINNTTQLTSTWLRGWHSSKGNYENVAINWQHNWSNYDVNYTNFGVRPVLWIDFTVQTNETGKYAISIITKPNEVTYTGLDNGELYDYDALINIKLSNVPEGYVAIWTDNFGKQTFGNEYSFNVPNVDVELDINLTLAYTKDNNDIYFGRYPQSLVVDEKIVQVLNEKAGDLPTSSSLYKWTDYKYYMKDVVKSYMYYQDIDLDNDGILDYRGVYFTEYRGWFTSVETDSNGKNSYQKQNGYQINNVYWFKYEPIKWNIKKTEGNKALIVAELTLDGQDFNNSNTLNKYLRTDGTGYANDYKLSTINKWLNDNFYNTAFAEFQKILVDKVTISDDAASTGAEENPYLCESFETTVFLLSYEEVTLYYSSDNERKSAYTAYSVCQGINVNNQNKKCYWWTRSPIAERANGVISVKYDGKFYNTTSFTNAIFGVRPCCWIIL